MTVASNLSIKTLPDGTENSRKGGEIASVGCHKLWNEDYGKIPGFTLPTDILIRSVQKMMGISPLMFIILSFLGQSIIKCEKGENWGRGRGLVLYDPCRLVRQVKQFGG
jgi:hypothetical protein